METNKLIFESQNKRIWLYWHQGWNKAPQLVARCVSTWIERNPDWHVHLLDENNLNDWLILPGYLMGKNLPLPALSDIIRIHLLDSYGGVWADATTWCSRPLSDWLNETVVVNGFFAYEKPAVDRPLSSWFLAAPYPNYITSTWRAAVDTYWMNRNSLLNMTDRPADPEYFWFHALFRELINNDKKFSSLWERRVPISADGPHYLQSRGLLENCAADDLIYIKNNITHLHKLTRRLNIPENITGTIIEALYQHG